MANEITAAVADAGLQEIWISEALEGLYDARIVSKEPVMLVKEVTGKQRGDQLDFTEFADSTVSNVGADGALTNVAPTHTARQVVLNTWQAVTWDVVDRVSAQSVFDYSVLAPKEQAGALGESMDDSILDDHGSFTGNNALGDTANPAPMNIDLALEADIVLHNVPLPQKEPRHWVLSPRAYGQLFKNELLAAADQSGTAKGAQVTGQIPGLLGYPILRTSRVVTTGVPSVTKNLLLGRRAIAMGISRDMKMDVFRTKKSHQYSLDVMYGEAVIRSNFAVTVNTRTAA